MFLQYGQREMEYLKSRDPKMGLLIDHYGHLEREVIPDLFTAVVFAITGQQISTKAHRSIFSRLRELMEDSITPERMLAASENELRACGLSGRKVSYICGLAQQIVSGEFDISAIAAMSDEEAIKALSSIKGIGRWTAEMILIFSLQRLDVLSYDDLGLRRGLCLIYHHRQLTPKLYAKYKRRFSPYGSVASLYIWEVSGGGLPELNHPKTANQGSEK